LPDDATLDGCTVTQEFDAALDGVDAVMMLRLQRERMEQGLVSSLEDYHRDYGLDETRLRRAASDAVVLHPGPMNRGVEIDDAVADGPQSLILQQVGNGVAVRMAVLEALLA
jgi:aspartate carbamoyltransferase catalytic subunit